MPSWVASPPAGELVGESFLLLCKMRDNIPPYKAAVSHRVEEALEKHLLLLLLLLLLLAILAVLLENFQGTSSVAGLSSGYDSALWPPKETCWMEVPRWEWPLLTVPASSPHTPASCPAPVALA